MTNSLISARPKKVFVDPDERRPPVHKLDGVMRVLLRVLDLALQSVDVGHVGFGFYGQQTLDVFLAGVFKLRCLFEFEVGHGAVLLSFVLNIKTQHEEAESD